MRGWQLQSRWSWYSIVFFLGSFTLYYLVKILDTGLTLDEVNGMWMTKVLASTDQLYVKFVDHQPPGWAILGLPFYYLFGPTVLAAKSAVFCYTLLFVLAVSYTAHALIGSRQSTLWTAALSGFFAALYNSHIGVNVSSYAATCIAVGIACAVAAKNNRYARTKIFIGGLLLGLGFMTKPSVALEIPIVFWIVYLLRRSWWDVLTCAVGGAMLVLGLIIYFAAAGTLYEMLYVSFATNFNYIGLAVLDMEIQGTAARRSEFFDEFVSKTLRVYASLAAVTAITGGGGRHQHPTTGGLKKGKR